MRKLMLSTCLLGLIGNSAWASDKPLQARADVNWRLGNERSILMTEFWVPLKQDEDGVIYGDLRMMGDDADNREFNVGVGYREIVTDVPVLGDGVAGVHGWFDRRLTERGSKFNQITLGGEWLGEDVDVLVNGYVPLSDEQFQFTPNANPQAPSLVGTGIVIDTDATILEEAQHGLDLEVGLELGQHVDFVKDHTDSFRLYGGGYYFDGPNTEDVAGWRVRASADITPNIQVGAQFQRDDVRGSQGFLEATFRFPFDSKQSYRAQGLRARLDDSPERDIDIVTGEVVSDPGSRVPVLNKATGQEQEVLHVDNTAAGGGDGSVETPFNTLSDAEAAASAHSVIYVHRGDGTSTNQDQGITLNQTGQQLIGTGTAFLYDQGRFTTPTGASPSSIVIAPASAAPTIGNINAGQDGVLVTANNITVAGLNVDNAGTGRDGIVVRADGAGASARDVTIHDVTTQNARMGIYLHGANSGALSAKVERSVATGNSQHGIAVYDDTDQTFEVDLGGGNIGSQGLNVLAGNTLEDLAVDYDGRILAAQNNWWGQASGPDTDTPDIGIRPQIYYGAPINDGLVGHWTFDTEWTTNTTAYDRSGLGNDGVLDGGLALSDQVISQNRQALNFDGVDDRIIYGNDNSLLISGDITITANIQTDTTKNEATIFTERNATLSRDYQFRLNNGNLIFNHANATGTVSSNKVSGFIVNDNNPAFVAFTADALDYNFFYNNLSVSGVLDFLIAPTGGNFPRQVGINAAFPGSVWEGILDDTRVYDRPLDPAEISQLYRMNTSSVVNTGSFLTSAP